MGGSQNHICGCFSPKIFKCEGGRDWWMVFYESVSVIWAVGTLIGGQDTKLISYYQLLALTADGDTKPSLSCSRAPASPNKPPGETFTS